MFKVPGFVKEYAGTAILGAIGFLFAFYVNTTYVDASELKAVQGEHGQILSAINALKTSMDNQRKWDAYNLTVDGLQDEIKDNNAEIERLTIEVEEAPQSILATARQRRIRQLRTENEELRTELEVMLRNEPGED